MVTYLTNPEEDTGYNFLNSGKSIKEGSCKDAEAYYYSAFGRPQQYLKEDDIFYHKTGHGSETSLLKRDIYIKGVRIPAGFLCRTNEEGRMIEPIRPTMFCFSAEEAEDAFGKQFIESQSNEELMPDFINGLKAILKIRESKD
jgi:hypothetical protein